jgi:hypothetical protein
MARNTSDLGEIEKDFRELDTTEQAILGTLTEGQRETLKGLERLVNSLAGPEDVLDSDSYSRPFPPLHPKKSER